MMVAPLQGWTERPREMRCRAWRTWDSNTWKHTRTRAFFTAASFVTIYAGHTLKACAQKGEWMMDILEGA